MKVLRAISSKGSIKISKSIIERNVICYSCSEFALGNRAASNKLPILEGAEDIFVVEDDGKLELPAYMCISRKSKGAIYNFISSVHSYEFDDRNPLNLYLCRTMLSLEMQRVLRQCNGKKASCHGAINTVSNSFMLYLLSVLISRGGQFQTCHKRPSKVYVLDGGLSLPRAYTTDVVRVTVKDYACLSDVLGYFFRAIKPPRKGQGCSANEVSFNVIDGEVKFEFYFVGKSIEFYFKGKYYSADGGDLIEPYRFYEDDGFMIGTIFHIAGAFYELLRYDKSECVLVNITTECEGGSIEEISLIRDYIKHGRAIICKNMQKYVINKSIDELRNLQAKPMDGLVFSLRPKLFNVKMESSSSNSTGVAIIGLVSLADQVCRVLTLNP